MNYRLTIYPALEAWNMPAEFTFGTAAEMLAAKNTAADLLLFIQDKMVGVMESYSSMFIMEEFVDDDWEEFEPDEE